MKELSICVVTFNCLPLIKKCVVSLQKNWNRDYELVIVDNNSKDGTKEYLKSLNDSGLFDSTQGKQVRVILNSQNNYFTKAYNQAIKASQSAEFILLLNPDTEILDDSLQKLAKFLEENPQVGAVVPKLVDPNGKIDPNIFGERNILIEVIESTILGRLFKFLPLMKKYRQTGFDWEKPCQVVAAGNACVLIRDKVFKNIGYLDENLKLYFSEDDFCRRMKDGGYQIYFLPAAKIIHKVRQIINKANQEEIYKIYRSDMLEFHRRYSREIIIKLLKCLLYFDDIIRWQ